MGVFDDINNEEFFQLFAPLPPRTSGVIIWLNSVLMPVILVIYTVILTISQYAGDPIDCEHIAKKNFFNDFLDTYCWIHGTHSIPDENNYCGAELSSIRSVGGSRSCDPSDFTCHRSHEYYQWVPLTLIFQAVCFYTPGWLWSHWERRKVEGVVGSSGLAALDTGFAMEEEELKLRAYQVRVRLSEMQDHARSWATRLVVVESLQLVNAVGQLALTNRFLGGEYLLRGLTMLTFLWGQPRNGACDPMSQLLPITSMCSVNVYGTSGKPELISALCVLPSNIWNQKFYAVFLVMLSALLLVNSCHLIFRITTMLSPTIRNRVLNFGANPGSSFSDWLLAVHVVRSTTPAIRPYLKELLTTDRDQMRTTPM